MGTVISNLKAKFGVDNSDFKKGLKDGEKAVDDFKGAAGSVLDEFASMFGINMSGVNDAIGTAGKSLNFLGQSFKAAAKGGDILALSAKLLKVALISSGIGAIVVALGSLTAYFTKSGKGADQFARILMQVKSVVNNVIDRLAVFGKGLYEIITGKFRQGWETMTGAFKGMGDEIKEDWKAAGDLADRFDALDDKERELTVSLSARKAKAEELRQLAKEETEDSKKKLQLLNEATKLIKNAYGDEIDLEKERLALMKEKLAMQSSDPTDEQLDEIAEQEGKINELLRAQALLLKGVAGERVAVSKVVAQELALEKTKAEQVKITRAEISNIKMPDFGIKDVLAPLAEVKEAIKTVSINLSEAFNESFENMAMGLGELLGSLMNGSAGVKDFGTLVMGTFADLAISIGKIAIGAGIATLGIKAALESMNGIAAIAAGTALVALGTAVKGSLKSVASGSSGSGGGQSYTYDTRAITSASGQQALSFPSTVKLVAEGRDLVGVIQIENNRKNVTT